MSLGITRNTVRLIVIVLAILVWLVVLGLISENGSERRTPEITPSDTDQAVFTSTAPLSPTLPLDPLPRFTPNPSTVAASTPTPMITLTPTVTPTPTITPTPTATPSAPAIPVAGVEISNGREVELAAQAGAYWIRRNALRWALIEPWEGARFWGAGTTLEAELRQAATLGLQTVLIIRDTPSWAQKLPGISCGPVASDQLGTFAAFLYDVVARYSQPPYNVQYYELGNEPDIDPDILMTGNNHYGCWGDQNDAYYGGGVYAEMLAIVYPQIKAANPDAQVLVGGLLLGCDPRNPPQKSDGSGPSDCSSALFLEGILRNGGGDYFDGVSFHTYDYYYGAEGPGRYANTGWYSDWKTTGPVLIAKARYISEVLAAYGHPEKYLLDSEDAILCGKSGDEPGCLTEAFEQTKAYYLVQANTAASAIGLRANIWYSMNGWRASGLVDRQNQPLLAYQALRFNAQALLRAAYWGEVANFPGVRIYEFMREGKRLWIVWSLDGENHSIHLENLPSAIYNTWGELLPSDWDVEVNLAPIYLEW